MFGRSVNPIQNGECRLSPSITTGTPKVFHLLASLKILQLQSYSMDRVEQIKWSKIDITNVPGQKIRRQKKRKDCAKYTFQGRLCKFTP